MHSERPKFYGVLSVLSAIRLIGSIWYISKGGYFRNIPSFQTLFDPINPDKDTVQTRKWTPHERADNEFWLLQRLDDIMEKANFQSLPQSEVKKALESHNASEGVKVKLLYLFIYKWSFLSIE